MEIGDKLLVYELSGFGYVDTPYALLTITEKRKNVPGSYGSMNNSGYKAVDQYGILYEWCWNTFPDEAMGGIVWYSLGTRDGRVIEEPKVWSHFTGAPRRITRLVEKYPELVAYCEMHHCTYLKEWGCRECSALKHNNDLGVKVDRKQDIIEY
jgi:hypothetical protein